MISLYELSAWKKKIVKNDLSSDSINKIKEKKINKPELVQKYGNLVASKNIMKDLASNKTNIDKAEQNKKVRFKLYRAMK